LHGSYLFKLSRQDRAKYRPWRFHKSNSCLESFIVNRIRNFVFAFYCVQNSLQHESIIETSKNKLFYISKIAVAETRRIKPSSDSVLIWVTVCVVQRGIVAVCCTAWNCGCVCCTAWNCGCVCCTAWNC
jgi:hypothetical protein